MLLLDSQVYSKQIFLAEKTLKPIIVKVVGNDMDNTKTLVRKEVMDMIKLLDLLK